jgi:hypothetical protein
MILFIIGIIVGLVGTTTGIGGGIFVVPILLSLYRFDPQLAVGTSLVVVALNAFSGTVAYARRKRIYWRISLAVIISGVPGVVTGAYASRFFTGPAFRFIFAGVLLLTALHLFLRHNNRSEDIKTYTPAELSPGRAAIMGGIGFLTGFTSALLGIGGGIIHVPALIYFLKMPVHAATATSQFILFNTVWLSIVPHAVWGHIDYHYGLLMGVGALIGAQAGAFISDRVHSRVIVVLLSCILTFVAVNLLL